jgi:hypothetical protein
VHELAALVDALRAQGVVVAADTDAGAPTVLPRGPGGPTAVLDLPEELLGAYLDDVAAGYAPFEDDPRATARSLVAVQLADQLTADHGGGVNRVRRLALVHDDDGLRLVEQRTDDAEPPPTRHVGADDEPAVYAAELRALAQTLRDQELDAVADPDRAEVRVGVATGGVVTVDLRPDLYRRYLEEQEEEYEALGGDPRAHAWTAWCRLVAGLLRAGAPELALVVAPDGQVRLVSGATADADLGWSAEPGR